MKRSPFLFRRIAALAAHALGDQHARARHAGRMELPELHVFERDAGARRHAEAVAGVDECVGASPRRCVPPRRSRSSVAFACRIITSPVSISSAVTPSTSPLGVADQVERHPFDEELRVRADVALIERVQHRMAGAVGRRARALHRTSRRSSSMWPPNGR